MKTLILVRHGKTEPAIPDKTDFERTLLDRGRDDVADAAASLAEIELLPQLIIASPANRAIETARIMAKSVGMPASSIKTRKALYEQNREDFLKIIREIGDIDTSVDTAMIVGHNPSIEEMSAYLCADFRKKVPTSGMVILEFPIDSWQNVERGTGTIRAGFTPDKSGKKGKNADGRNEKEKKREKRKKLQEGLENRLTAEIERILAEVDEPTAAKMRTRIEETSGKLAKKFIKKRDE